jgi:hypothetical protein
MLARGEPAVGQGADGGARKPRAGHIRHRSLRIEHDREQPLDAGKPRMPPRQGLKDFPTYSHPTAGAVG